MVLATAFEVIIRSFALLTACEVNFTVTFGSCFATSLAHVAATNQTTGANLGVISKSESKLDEVNGTRALLIESQKYCLSISV
ncbi:hypothetical protein ABE61_18590 [Lysinibacillus sphaericus]|nr:hypothetical protein [Lysinibacillus sphaericus]MBG9479636.1 hypothetical protein [Lysinibacillus sphaericus]MBG9593882.1 hypothetical protein [Lysinibacillus sphaericus]